MSEQISILDHQGIILWFTGLPGSGKTTLAHALGARLRLLGARVQVLDGDEIRGLQHGRIGFSKEERNKHVELVATMAYMLKNQGVICIVALIAPYTEVRMNVLSKVGGLEVFVDAPVEVCRQRDPKGLYAQAFRGEIKKFTGVDDPYESPVTPDIHLETHLKSVDECVEKVWSFLNKRGYIDEMLEALDCVYRPMAHEKIWSRFPLSAVWWVGTRGRRSAWYGLLKGLWTETMQAIGLDRYRYRYRVLFVAGLPKSGTTWLMKMLGMIPGYRLWSVYDPSRLPFFHDVSPLTFDLLPRHLYSVVKFHTRYTPHNFNTIIKKVGRFIVLYRDLRDMCVSRYHHVLNEEGHRHNALYQKLSSDEALTHCIRIIENEYVPWVSKWVAVASEHPDIICQVTYEELRSDLRSTMERVLTFFDIRVDEKVLEAMSGTQMLKEASLRESLKNGTTKRKGVVGDWKNHFNEEHKSQFKKAAGILLVKLGYEKDLAW